MADDRRRELLLRKKQLLEQRKNVLVQQQKQPQDPFLPRAGEVEKLQAERPTAIERFGGELRTPFKGGLGQRAIKAGVTGLKGAAIPFQIAESAIAAPLGALQRGQFNPIELAQEAIKGAKGDKVAEFGDIIRTTGFGGPANEAISAFVGFGTSLAAANIASKGKITTGARKIKEANIAKKQFFFKQQADKLNKGVDEVFNGIRGEFDKIYNKIGNNPIGERSQAVVQDIVNRLPTNILGKIKTKAQVTGRPRLGEFVATKEKFILDPVVNTAKSIKTEIGKNIPSKVWSGIDDATEVQAKLMDDYFNLNDIIAESAGELRGGLLDLNAKFKRLHRFNRVIKGITRKPRTGVTSTEIRGIRTPSRQGELFELQEFSKEFFPQTERIIKDVDKFNRIQSIKKGTVQVAKLGLGFEAGRRFIVNPLFESVGGGGGGR